MGRIIALQGKANIGKTTTIKLLPDILIANGYSQVPGLYQNHGNDFLDVFENGDLRVGVTSSGDNHDLVFDRLTDLINAGCDVCVCACRTYDRMPPGSVAAVNEFPTHPPQFVQKTLAPTQAQEQAINRTDANQLFRLI